MDLRPVCLRTIKFISFIAAGTAVNLIGLPPASASSKQESIAQLSHLANCLGGVQNEEQSQQTPAAVQASVRQLNGAFFRCPSAEKERTRFDMSSVSDKGSRPRAVLLSLQRDQNCIEPHRPTFRVSALQFDVPQDDTHSFYCASLGKKKFSSLPFVVEKNQLKLGSSIDNSPAVYDTSNRDACASAVTIPARPLDSEDAAGIVHAMSDKVESEVIRQLTTLGEKDYVAQFKTADVQGTSDRAALVTETCEEVQSPAIQKRLADVRQKRIQGFCANRRLAEKFPSTCRSAGSAGGGTTTRASGSAL